MIWLKQRKKLLIILGGFALFILILALLLLNASSNREKRIAAYSRTASAAPVEATEPIRSSSPVPTEPPIEETETQTVTAITPEPTAPVKLSAEQWRDWSVAPLQVSDTLKTLYHQGIAEGNNPRAFSKVGDSNSVMPSFLSCFDYGEFGYKLGSYAPLEETIANFYGSFSRTSRATKVGVTATELDGYHWYEDEICWPYESATTCEFRLQKPSIAFISLGTNDVLLGKTELFDRHLRSLVQKSLDRKIVPILGTKADDLEGDGGYNRIIVQVAIDYDVPVWNLWKAMRDLPNNGLISGDVHPTFNKVSLCDFSGDDLTRYGWNARNLSALQALDAVWHLLNQ